jgi:hypothetical protein
MILYLMIKELSPLIKIELTQPQINWIWFRILDH